MITGIVTVEGVVEDGAGAKADTRDREREGGRGREIGDLFACNRSRV